MDKPLLERFIGKYNLGGAANAVIVNADSNGLHTRFISDDKNILGIVNASKVDLEEGEYGIYNTDQLRSLLGVLDDKMKIKVVKTKGTPTGFLLSDKSTKVTYVLADKQNFSSVPDLKKLPNFEVEVKVDEKFLQTFVRAKGALPDVSTFTLITDGKKAQIILGYSEKQNTNRVSIEVETEKNGEIDPISFSAQYLKEALIANKEMKSGLLKISSSGLAHLSFDVEDFEVDYYLVKIERKD
jgi:hypothetical protein